MKAISESYFLVIEAKRRPGDPACVMAESDKIRQVLNWQPKYNQSDTIIATTLAWEMQKEANHNNLIGCSRFMCHRILDFKLLSKAKVKR